RLSLAANVAKSWCNIITARQRLELAEQTRDSFVSNYRITERNYKAGDETATPLSVQFGRNNVASAERNVIARTLARENAARPLEVLLGRYPSGKLKSSNRLPELPEEVPAGLPSELLWRRPDIAAAEASLRASARRADAARKNMLPSFSLTARGSDASGDLNRILANPETILWNAASSLAQSIFRGGALSAQAQRALAQNEQALHNFTNRVLEALREVESALATERSLAEQERFISIELAQAKLAEAQAGRDYSEGLIGILSIFEAQRRGVAARNAMITLRNQRLQNRIDLHLALGGDFKTLPAEEPEL
ncbi:MAG: TolC family protein, partial [Verrucomicrobiaceae bacterium]|nr:TolC family protein [Verrucomicrobiaceae bacterium]